MRDNISPEEKLLRLIRGHKSQPAAGQLPAKIIPPPAAKNLFPYARLIQPRKILLTVFIFSCLYLVASLAYSRWALRPIKLPKPSSQRLAELKPDSQKSVKPFEYYQNEITSRSLFTDAGQQNNAQPAQAASADLIKDINLVGIIAGENPQAVIEDKKSARTYYVSKGQRIGEMLVDDIQEGKIIISYRGQRYELYL